MSSTSELSSGGFPSPTLSMTTTATVPPSPPGTPGFDGEYFWDFVTFKVEGRLFRVPKYRFVEESECFPSLFDSESGFGQEYDLGDLRFDCVKLEDVTVGEFQTFLKVLYPRDFETPPNLSQDQWMSILVLATKWRFGDLRKRAINEIKSYPTLSEKIQLAKALTIPAWLTAAYMELVIREAPLSLTEAEQFGMTKTLSLYDMREKYIRSQRNCSGMRADERVREIERVFATEFEAMRKKEVEMYPTKEQKRKLVEAEIKEAEEARQRAEKEAALKGEEEYQRLRKELEAALEEQKRKLEMLKHENGLALAEDVGPNEFEVQAGVTTRKKKKNIGR